jgi:hypothetical protein
LANDAQAAADPGISENILYRRRRKYTADGEKTRTAYGLEQAKDLERFLTAAVKDKTETLARRMTLQQLFDEYICRLVRQYGKCKPN